tara:strand:- start:87 stop:371 length:285 start_codon:yes stop_codon:yes gene_type:complete
LDIGSHPTLPLRFLFGCTLPPLLSGFGGAKLSFRLRGPGLGLILRVAKLSVRNPPNHAAGAQADKSKDKADEHHDISGSHRGRVIITTTTIITM